jgi:hypothetical protein
MFCTQPCWGGDTYWCKYLVAIEKHNIRRGTDSNYSKNEEEYLNLTEERSFFDKEEFSRLSNFESLADFSYAELKRMATRPFRKLKPEVLDWLNENIKDGPEGKGWCCGNDEYLYKSWESLSLFFYRKLDALNFIEQWSIYKVPTTYFDYFRGIRKELNVETKRLVKV